MLKNDEIGRRIRARREQLGLSREQLGERAGISGQFCRDIEQGKRSFSLQTLIKIARELGLSTDYILFGVDAKRHQNALRLLDNIDPDNQGTVEDILRLLTRF